MFFFQIRCYWILVIKHQFFGEYSRAHHQLRWTTLRSQLFEKYYFCFNLEIISIFIYLIENIQHLNHFVGLKQFNFQTKMKIFKIVQKQYAILCISSSTVSNQPSQFLCNKNVLFGLSLYAYLIVSQFVYIFYEADGLMEYMNGISATFGSVIVFVCFAAIVSGSSTVFAILNHLEQLINTSEQHIFPL